MAPGYKFCGPTQYSDKFNKISKEVHLLVKYRDTSYGLSHKRFCRQTTTAKIKVNQVLYDCKTASIDFVRESDMPLTAKLTLYDQANLAFWGLISALQSSWLGSRVSP